MKLRWSVVSGQWLVNRKTVIFCLLLTAYCLLFTTSTFAQDAVNESLSELSRIIPLKKVVKTPWGRDPFVPLVGGAFARQSDLRLTAIIYNTKKPSAIINNKIIYIGDNIDGEKVVDITKQYVILRGISGTYKLGIDEMMGHGYDFKKKQSSDEQE